MSNDIALFVASCDKYRSAWYPFFELIKMYWPGHPDKIYLSTETHSYRCLGLNIITLNAPDNIPWSQRIIEALQRIPEKYVIFTLEDFFLLGNVDNQAISRCKNWMDEDASIVECRLSTYATIHEGEQYQGSDFRICPPNHSYRIDTQVAVWRKDFLISILDPSESPWQFETQGSIRSMSLSEKLLWFSPKDEDDIATMIFPYYNGHQQGYGIGWGKWRPKNRQWFKENGIDGVKFGQLGELSEKDIERRYKYLYVNPTTLKGRIVKQVMKSCIAIDRLYREIRLNGLQGVKKIYHKIRK